MIRKLSFKGNDFYAYCLDDPLHSTYITHDDEMEVRDAFWNIEPGFKVIDIGASFGSYTLTALAAGAGFVWSFCPQGVWGAKESSILSISLELNKWSTKCKIFNSGLYNRTGYLNPDNQFFQNYGNDSFNTDGANLFFPVETLDNWAEREISPHDKINFVKIDVEGAELDILLSGRNFISKHKPNILIELHGFKNPLIESSVRQFLCEFNSYCEIGPVPHSVVSHSLFRPSLAARNRIVEKKSLRIGFIFGPQFLSLRRFDFGQVWDDPRGLTGSEYSYLRVALGLKKLGHDVHLFTLQDGDVKTEWEGMKVHSFDDINKIDSSFSAVVSWNEAELFRHITSSVLRVVSFQINSFYHCHPGFDEFVDFWASPSQGHLDMLFSEPQEVGKDFFIKDQYYAPRDNAAKWLVIPHGCNLNDYDGVEKVPGRVIWASSPDRGVHWLLQEWPKIKRAVPHAHLRIFYRLRPWIDYHKQFGFSGLDTEESFMRSTYVDRALSLLKPLSVELIDAVSRNQINKEMAAAEVFPYTCDTLRWSEGFSITLLEACAARACPITTAIDALPSVYGGSVPMIDIPVKDNINKFTDLVIKALQDKEYRDSVNKKVYQLAEKFTWQAVCEQYEKLFYDNLKV